MLSNTAHIPRIFITGIGTDVGKTVVSAIVAKALHADYWKPIQAGDLNNTDSMKVEAWIGPNVVHPEAYQLNTPASPHYAAKKDAVSITLDATKLPSTNKTLVIEGAGGVMVPINEKQTLLDVVINYTKYCIVVSKHYLGSINHTLLTIASLKNKGYHILGVIFTGDDPKESENIIITLGEVTNLGNIPWTTNLDQRFIEEQAIRIKKTLLDVINQTT
jgi:dethiobiotin synthetase